MKLRLPALLSAALLSCMVCASTVRAATYLAEGVELNRDNTVNTTTSDRFYDGGKGRDWDEFERAARTLYDNNGKDLSIFGDLASSISVSNYQAYLDCSKLYDDSKQCWAYTSSNMLQYWQTYYGVFSKKVGEDKEAPVHGYSYDTSYLSELGGTQSLKLNKLFYESFNNKGGQPLNAFGWYLSLENDWTGQKDLTSSPGYFQQYFTSYKNTTKTVDAQSISSLEAMSNSLKQAFGYTQQNGEWAQTTMGQITHLELKSGSGSHAITCYGFETDAEGNITALYIVNSDDAKYGIIKVYTKFEEFGYMDYRLTLHYDEECSGYETYNAWAVTGWSTINTPEVLKNMLKEYESGKMTWMGREGVTWKNSSDTVDVNVLPTDETGWMSYAGTGTEHAGYYNTYYTAERGVVFNDDASSGTVNVEEDITISSMEVNNSSLAYTFEGGETTKTLTVDEFTKKGSAAVTFDGVDVVAGTATIEGDVTFDNLHVTGTLNAEEKTIHANNITLDGNATIGTIGGINGENVTGTTELTITGGTTTIQNSGSWTNLKSLALSDTAKLNVGASIYIAENITSTDITSGSLAKGTVAGIDAKYCIKVGTAGKEGTGNVQLAGDMKAGAYIQILGDAAISGDLRAVGEANDHHVTIGGNATIGGQLSVRRDVTIGGHAAIGKGGSVGGTLTAGSLSLAAGTTLTATGGISVKGALTGGTPTQDGGAKAALQSSGAIELGGSVSNISLKAQSVTLTGGTEGNPLSLEGVEMVLQGGELDLVHAVVRGESSFSSGNGGALTLRAEQVTFVLDESNSSLQPTTFRAFDLTEESSLVQTAVQANPLYLDSSLLQGVDVSGNLTLDLSYWMDTVRAGSYDSIVLSFAEGTDFSQVNEVRLALGDGSSTLLTPDAGSPNTFTFAAAQVPAPATATLSLLALAALAARRRRR